MAQEFFINSQTLQDKISSLLPSQGGAGAGFDLSASTQIIPIIDLTESAEGSNLRQDLQSSFSHSDITSFLVENATTTIINNTGYYRVFGTVSLRSNQQNTLFFGKFSISDGVTSKIVTQFNLYTATTQEESSNTYDFIVFLGAGDSLIAQTGHTENYLQGCTRQIASIDGTLTNPA
jgi:hypothetical protein